MSFAAPVYLVVAAAILPALALLWLAADRLRRRALARFAAEETRRRLVTTETPGTRRLRRVALALGLAFVAVALARPQWGEAVQAVSRLGVDVVIAIDTSLSMTAEDMKPSRLEHARSFAADLVRALEGHRIGLVVFAGEPQVLCPLTFDDRAALVLLDAVSPGEAVRAGTSLAEAVEVAAGVFPAGERKSKVVILLSDGEDRVRDPLPAVRAAAAAGVVVHTVGFGTKGGEPLPIRDDRNAIKGYVKDAGGKVVLSRLNAELLATVAAVGKGVAVHASQGENAIAALRDEVDAMEKKQWDAVTSTRHVERFQVFLGLGLALLAAEAGLRTWPGRLRKPVE